MSRVLDRQRHGGSFEAPPAPLFVLQAPQLLRLGQLQAPQLEPLPRKLFEQRLGFFPEHRAASATRCEGIPTTRCEGIPTPSRRRDEQRAARRHRGKRRQM